MGVGSAVVDAVQQAGLAAGAGSRQARILRTLDRSAEKVQVEWRDESDDEDVQTPWSPGEVDGASTVDQPEPEPSEAVAKAVASQLGALHSLTEAPYALEAAIHPHEIKGSKGSQYPQSVEAVSSALQRASVSTKRTEIAGATAGGSWGRHAELGQSVPEAIRGRTLQYAAQH